MAIVKELLRTEEDGRLSLETIHWRLKRSWIISNLRATYIK